MMANIEGRCGGGAGNGVGSLGKTKFGETGRWEIQLRRNRTL